MEIVTDADISQVNDYINKSDWDVEEGYRMLIDVINRFIENLKFNEVLNPAFIAFMKRTDIVNDFKRNDEEFKSIIERIDDLNSRISFVEGDFTKFTALKEEMRRLESEYSAINERHLRLASEAKAYTLLINQELLTIETRLMDIGKNNSKYLNRLKRGKLFIKCILIVAALGITIFIECISNWLESKFGVNHTLILVVFFFLSLMFIDPLQKSISSCLFKRNIIKQLGIVRGMYNSWQQEYKRLCKISGISESDLNKIIEKFYKIDQGR